MRKQMITLKWKFFIPNLSSSLSDAVTKNSFSDVTLVSDDKVQFQAHKYVLSASSPILKDILLENPHPHPLIYLNGVNHQELESILQFIYLGEASIYHGNINRFIQAAEGLQVKQRAETVVKGNIFTNQEEPLDEYDGESRKDDISSQDMPANIGDQRVDSRIGDTTINNEISATNPSSNALESGKHLYTCDKCEASYKSKAGLWYHTRIKHEGVVYPCQQCSYKARQPGHLKTHQQSIHEGLKYFCNKCEYQATRKSDIKKHEQSVHDGIEGVKYSCNHCAYQTAVQSNLKTHQQSIHDGVKYFCDQCEYQAGQKTNLRRHISTKHSLLVETFITGRSSIAQEKTNDDHDDKSDGASNQDIHANSDDDAEYENDGISNSSISDEIIKLDLSAYKTGSNEQACGKQSYKCKKCDVTYKSKTALLYHTRSKHEGIVYSCQQCSYKGTNLKRHQQTIHESIKYSCNHCDYQAGEKTRLKTHKRYMH